MEDKKIISDFLKKVSSDMREKCKSRKMTQSEIAESFLYRGAYMKIKEDGNA